MKEMQRSKYREKAENFHAFSNYAILPVPPCAHQCQKLQTPSFGFLWKLYYKGMID